MSACQWVPCHNFQMPSGAIGCGVDTDGHQIYIGQTMYHGDELPVKIVPHRREAYICHGGVEVRVHQFKVLCRTNLTWEHASGGHVPTGAVTAGRTSSGETLYVGRCKLGRGIAVGKVHPSHRCLYVPYDGKEQAHAHYEVLVARI